MPDEEMVKPLPPGKYKVASFDLDATGRRLHDEICHIGCFLISQGTERPYSQYIIPHRNPNQAAKRAYGFRIVNIGMARMLKDFETGLVLKTKSEISALQGFLSWLEEVKGDSDGIILVSHEQMQGRCVLVPLLLQALERYQLTPRFSNLVKGFCNSVNVINEFGNKDEITSLSLRSLCKTVLCNTDLPTKTALERCQRVYEIVSRVTGAADGSTNGDSKDSQAEDNMLKVVPMSSSLEEEKTKLGKLLNVEAIERTMRPIFHELMRHEWRQREQMVRIRRAMADMAIDYAALQGAMKNGELDLLLSKVDLPDQDKQQMIIVVKNHFNTESPRREKRGGGRNNKTEEATNKADEASSKPNAAGESSKTESGSGDTAGASNGAVESAAAGISAVKLAEK